MQLALGILQWPPQAFWKATPAELYAAVEGWQEKNGINPDKDDGAPPPLFTPAEVEAMRELMDGYPDVWK